MIITDCDFPGYTVTRWGSKPRLGGKRWIDAANKLHGAVASKKGFQAGVIVGEPGMGKTAVILYLKERLSTDGEFHVIFLDLAGKDDFVGEFWENANVEKLKEEAYKVLERNKKNVGYTGLTLLSKEFKTWLKQKCKKKDYGDDFAYAFRIYCNSYSKTLDDVSNFIADVRRLGKEVVLLIDEMRNADGIIRPLHRLLNSDVEFKLILTLIPDVLTSIKDSAIRRRLEDALRIELSTPITEEEEKGIIEVYCPEFADALAKAVNESSDSNKLKVNDILIKARELYNKAKENCVGSSSDCIARFLSGASQIKNPQDLSRGLERSIRDGLRELQKQKEFDIEYVHPSGKRLEGGVTPDVFFKTKEKVYIGDIKITNKEGLSKKELSNVWNFANIGKLEDKDVVKFVISNVKNLDLPSEVKVFEIDNYKINKIVDGDHDLLLQELRRILKELISG
ncbi:MAG: ATP-binding protein [Candidatus Aramenus sp.]|nr:ATP-binding protein [Candidatus Aramenus sp.]